MTIDPAKLQSIINELVAQTVARLNSDGEKDINAGDTALVLLPKYISEPKLLADYIEKTFRNARYIFAEGSKPGQDFQGVRIDDEASKQEVIASLGGYQNIVLAFPSVNVVKKIAGGEDEGFAETVVTKALLKNKNVVIILDFSLQPASHSKWLKSIFSAVKDVEEAGAEFVTLSCTCEEEQNALELVTEADVARIFDSGSRTIHCKKGAVVTPLAKDRANELGLTIEM